MGSSGCARYLYEVNAAVQSEKGNAQANLGLPLLAAPQRGREAGASRVRVCKLRREPERRFPFEGSDERLFGRFVPPTRKQTPTLRRVVEAEWHEVVGVMVMGVDVGVGVERMVGTASDFNRFTGEQAGRHRSPAVASVEAFVQYLASNLIRHGYWYHFVGHVPPHKDPAAVDRKLAERYQANLDKFTRSRRKKKGLANVAYVRHERTFVLLTTEGDHAIFDEHPMLDLRRRPIRLFGYSIGAGRGHDGKFHASVRIGDEAFAKLESYFLDIATHRSAQTLADELRKIRFVPYARVRRQFLKLLRLVNERREMAGYEPVPLSALTLRRSIVTVFEQCRKRTDLGSEAQRGLG